MLDVTCKQSPIVSVPLSKNNRKWLRMIGNGRTEKKVRFILFKKLMRLIDCLAYIT